MVACFCRGAVKHDLLCRLTCKVIDLWPAAGRLMARPRQVTGHATTCAVNNNRGFNFFSAEMLAECIIPPVRHWNNLMNVFQCNRPDCDFLENEAYHKKAYYFEFIHVSWGSGKTKYVPIPYIHGWIARVNMCCTSMSIWTIYMYLWPWSHLTHWGRVTHICIGNLTIIGSDNGLSPGRRQVIIWTNAGILSIGPLRNKLQWNFNRNSNILIQENAL